MTPRPRDRVGFTLLETLLAIGLVAALLAVAVRLVEDVSSARDRVAASLRRTEGLTLAIDLLADRLATATATAVDGGAGIEGDALSCRVTGAGVASIRLTPGSRRSPLLDRSTLELAWRGDGLALRDDEGDWSTAAEGLAAIRFRYHDGEDWRDSWDGARDGLPVAVELSIWTTPWPDGLVAAWMPPPEDEAGIDDLDDLSIADDGSFDSSLFDDLEGFAPPPVAAEDDEVPPADRRRVMAILDPVAPSDVADGGTEAAP